MASTVFLHVGAPLAPSTTLRDALGRHRRRLARVGVLYPPGHLGHDEGHRDAVLDVLSLTAEEPAPRGAWDRLAAGVRDWRRGTAVVSHELLADATPAQVDRVASSLGGAELHVVYVAQDLGRQLPRAWAQWVRSGGTVPWATYAARVLNRDQHRLARVFWRSHDLGEVLERWEGVVPAERVHVVTAARDRDDRTWARFASTIGVDPDRFRLGPVPEGGLSSLAGLEVLRLLHSTDVPPGRMDPQLLATAQEHATSTTGPAPRIPSDLREAVEAETERMVAAARSHGVDLVGDVTDLRVSGDAFAAGPEEVTPPASAVLRAQTDVLHAMCSTERRGPAGMRRRALRVLRVRVRP